jgi:hypothetical protein
VPPANPVSENRHRPLSGSVSSAQRAVYDSEMSKKKAAKPPRAPQPAVADDQLLSAARAVHKALVGYRAAAETYKQELVALPPILAGLTTLHESLLYEIQIFDEAQKIVQDDSPVAPRDDRGLEWAVPQTPEAIIVLAQLAESGDLDYRSQLSLATTEKAAREAARDDALATQCGRPTATGAPCKTRPAYWPLRGYSGSCARHLEQSEVTLLTEMYDRAIANVDCPGCGRAAGKTCSQEARDIRTVDGRWATLKAFNSRQLHTARLDGRI